MNKPKLYKGGISEDSRGSVSYNNNLKLKKIRRFYVVKNKKKILLGLGMVIKLKLNLLCVLREKQKLQQ